VSEQLSIETSIHGRVLVERCANTSAGWLIAFHGYGQSADDALSDVMKIPGIDRWHVAAVQALNRFYTRNDEKVVASWMTRQDREVAIADNISYVDRVVEQLQASSSPLMFAGFSQGVAMAYRAALRGTHRAAGVIALAGDIPPELKTDATGAWPRVLIGRGNKETWFTEDKLRGDVAFLESRHVPHEVVRFTGGHEWTEEFRAAAGRRLALLST
jgi:predicted esterase